MKSIKTKFVLLIGPLIVFSLLLTVALFQPYVGVRKKLNEIQSQISSWKNATQLKHAYTLQANLFTWLTLFNHRDVVQQIQENDTRLTMLLQAHASPQRNRKKTNNLTHQALVQDILEHHRRDPLDTQQSPHGVLIERVNDLLMKPVDELSDQIHAQHTQILSDLTWAHGRGASVDFFPFGGLSDVMVDIIRDFKSINYAFSILNGIENQMKLCADSILQDTPAHEYKFSSYRQKNRDALAAWAVDAHSQEIGERENDEEIIQRLKSVQDQIERSTYEIRNQMRAGNRKGAKRLYDSEIKPIHASMVFSGVERLVLGKFAEMEADMANWDRTMARIRSGLMAIFLVLLLLNIMILLFIGHEIVLPIEELTLMSELLRSGKRDAQNRVRIENEIGVLAKEMNRLSSDLRVSWEKIQEQNSSLEKRVEEKTKEVEETYSKLLQAEKLSAIGQLAGGVAHEINNPLGIILGFAQSVKSRMPADSPLIPSVEFIAKEALRCKDIVQNLLTFSRRSKSDLRESVNISHVIDDTLFLIEAQCHVKNVEVIKDFKHGDATLSANKNQLQQIVLNLCNNAIDAMPDGGQLRIETAFSEDQGKAVVDVRVSDTGTGIPVEIQEKIFDPFFTTKEVGKGTGLGLSIIYEIVQKHRGTILLQSQLGKGSCFLLRFPADENISLKVA